MDYCQIININTLLDELYSFYNVLNYRHIAIAVLVILIIWFNKRIRRRLRIYRFKRRWIKKRALESKLKKIR